MSECSKEKERIVFWLEAARKKAELLLFELSYVTEEMSVREEDCFLRCFLDALEAQVREVLTALNQVRVLVRGSDGVRGEDV